MTVLTRAIRAAYEELQPRLPVFPGEREWVDRLRDWASFVEFGQLVVQDLRELLADERGGTCWANGEYQRRRAMCPELFDLVLRAFPEKKFRA